MGLFRLPDEFVEFCIQRPERLFSISWLGAGRRKRTTHSIKNNISRYAPKYIRYRITKSACNDLLIGMRPASLITGLGDSVPRTYQVSMSCRKSQPNTIIPVQIVYGFIFVRASRAHDQKRNVSQPTQTSIVMSQNDDNSITVDTRSVVTLVILVFLVWLN
jgi:hypothetical protein